MQVYNIWYKSLYMYDLQKPVQAADWLSSDCLVVATSDERKHELLELSLPAQVCVQEDSSGLTKDRDFQVVNGGFTDSSIISLHHLRQARKVLACVRGDNSVETWQLGSEDGNLIEKIGVLCSKKPTCHPSQLCDPWRIIFIQCFCPHVQPPCSALCSVMNNTQYLSPLSSHPSQLCVLWRIIFIQCFCPHVQPPCSALCSMMNNTQYLSPLSSHPSQLCVLWRIIFIQCFCPHVQPPCSALCSMMNNTRYLSPLSSHPSQLCVLWRIIFIQCFCPHVQPPCSALCSMMNNTQYLSPLSSHPSQLCVLDDSCLVFGSDLSSLSVADINTQQTVAHIQDCQRDIIISNMLQQDRCVLTSGRTSGELFLLDPRSHTIAVEQVLDKTSAQQVSDKTSARQVSDKTSAQQVSDACPRRDTWTLCEDKSKAVVLQMCSSGVMRVRDCRNLKHCVKSVQTKLQAVEPGEITLSSCPTNADLVAVTGFDGCVQIYDRSKWGDADVVTPVFVHQGHIADREDPSQVIVTSQHLWYPWKQGTLLSAASDGGLHIFQPVL
ncbi:WD repeat-containing protein 73-like isoform X2 [Haliotis rufescens]|uniref:WD repeat-containing protein 73-like isoform X2 n=1 Tax=Haliotis rufescens TaxID=6454 RepID=UPI00201F54C4|nr:WD repeat-containing protein 73-like isoform X2 [Haliotis rufescens]